MEFDYSKNEKQYLAPHDSNKLSLETSVDGELDHINIPLDSQRTTISSNAGGYQPPSDNTGKPPVKSDAEVAFANKYQERAANLQENFDLGHASHPIVCVFTVLFKGLAAFSYLFVPYLFNDVIAFIFTVLFISADFWMVKNVSGRLLVGLRWWTAYNEDGSEKWHFESPNENRPTNPIDSRFFWASQIGAAVFWSIFSIFALFGLKIFWGSACGIALSLTATNLWAYYKCNKDYQRRMESLVHGVGVQVATKAMSNFL
mmetsp:Transcript_19784/g.22779  ORF Transcript_19784/g.22779 Transcript_19784/m.22779 type:complete len:259 (+) Transcript_19784:56-832(+)